MSVKDRTSPAATDFEPELVRVDSVPQSKIECKTVLEWALVKGHNPAHAKTLANVHKQKAVARGKQHKGPHVFVVLTHLGGGNAAAWPENKLVTEAEYDAAVSAAYGVTLR